MFAEPRLRRALARVALCALCAAAPAAAQDATAPDDPAHGAIRVYQQHLSAMRHMHCRFVPSCSQYASDAIARYGLVEGSARAADRLMRCNRSADSRYRRSAEGLLVEPVGEAPRGPAVARVPGWLLPEPEHGPPPRSLRLPRERAARLDEAVEFAQLLEQRGDCERASAEFQRAGMLADTLPAHAWAYARIARCYLDASQWYFADRAYLTSAMLTSDTGTRASVGYAAAVSRFDAEAFTACARLLADPALTAGASGSGPASAVRLASADGSPPLAPDERVGALAGLCAFALGDWDGAARGFGRATQASPSAERRERIATLAQAASRGPELPRRSPAVAGTLSALLPGAGQVYCGRRLDGLRHLLFNAALVYTVVTIAQHDEVPAAVIVGSVELPFYLGNVIGAKESARQWSRERRMQLLVQGIAASAR
jgi:putative membrane protein insertion efficiency factor